MTQTAPRTVPYEQLLLMYQRERELRIKAEEDSNHYKQEYYKLKQHQDWQTDLHAVKQEVISVSHKATIKATVQYMRDYDSDPEQQRDTEGYVLMNPWKVGRMAGQGDQTTRDNWSYCSIEHKRIKGGKDVIVQEGALPVFDKKLVKVSTPDLERYPRGFYHQTWMRERDLLYHPKHYTVGTPRKHGGAPLCDCGGELLVEDRVLTRQRRTTCTRCGAVHVDPPRPVNEGWEPTSTDASTDEKSQIDIFREEDEKSQLDQALTTLPLPCQVDFFAPESMDGQVAIPAALREKPQWVVWRFEENEQGKLTKVPYQAKRARSPQKASTTDPETWASYEQAKALYEQSVQEGWKQPYAGIGFVFNDDFTGIDLDCDKETGELSLQAPGILEFIKSYAEWSPNGGLHIIARGTIPTGVKRKGVEMYSQGRFFTITGQRLGARMIEDCQVELTILYDELTAPPEPKTEPKIRKLRTLPVIKLSDVEVLNLARNARNGAKFRALFDDGSTTGYTSQSEADLALCSHLAWWTNGDAEAIDRLFRQSKLMRPKWDRAARRGETYGEGTIREVLE